MWVVGVFRVSSKRMLRSKRGVSVPDTL
jgi:hypothetical protein